MSVFNNVTEASELLSISQNSIRNSIQKGYMGGEYYWKRFSINFPLRITIKKQLKKRISAICPNSNKMYVFNSFAEAALFFNKERKAFSNAIRNAIVKKNGIYKNYIWKEN